MNLSVPQRSFIRLLAIVLVALVVEETVRYGLRVYSHSMFRRGNGEIPVSKSIRELALTYPSTLQVSDGKPIAFTTAMGWDATTDACAYYPTSRAALETFR